MEPVVSDPVPDWAPAWSPNGREVAFYWYRSGNRDVWVISLHGGAARQLTDNPAADRFPSWSPNGQRIVFVSNRSGPAGIWITPARGGEATKIPGLGGRPYWSPDGKWLAVLGWLPSVDAFGEVWGVSVVAAAPPRRLAAKSGGNCGDWYARRTDVLFRGHRKGRKQRACGFNRRNQPAPDDRPQRPSRSHRLPGYRRAKSLFHVGRGSRRSLGDGCGWSELRFQSAMTPI